MPESNLFAEAIADAKAVRATALANAKVALEEAFSQRYHAMFAEKLKEDANAPVAPSTPAGAPAPAQGNDVSAQEIDELIKELEAEVGQNPDPNAPPVDASLGGAVPPPAPGLPGAVPPPAVPGAVPPLGAACPPAVPGLPGAVPPPMPLGGIGGAPPVPPTPSLDGAGAPPAPSFDGSTPPPSDVPPTGPEETDEEVNLEELLEDLKKEMETDDEDKDKLEEDTKLTSSGVGGKVGVPSGKMPANGTRSSSTIAGSKHQETGIPDGKVTAKEPTNATRPNSIGLGIDGTPSLNETKETGIPDGKVTAKEPTEATCPNSIGNGIEDTPKLEEVIKEKNSLQAQLSEAVKAITFVRSQLNEVNLLNAKLLYTNKLFKEFQLSNEQKMRVVEMFDLNKNVREVKLTYANLAEAMNFSGDSRRKVTSSTVQSITEGLASNAIGTTKPSKQIISEGKANEMVSKFQRLAGIKAPVTKK